MDYFNDDLTMFSGPENISVTLLSMEGQKAPGFHKKMKIKLCSKDERRSYGFGTT